MNPFRKLIAPRLPRAAVALSGEGAGLVQLEGRGGGLVVRSAGYVPLPEGLLRPGFDEQNVADAGELAASLADLAQKAGQGKRRRWSAGLPEAATRTSILTLETAGGSRAEAEEMLRWKTERALGAPPDELRISRERLTQDAQGRARYLVTAVRLPVLAEYEQVFASLGWQTGLVLPRHMGESWWLMRGGGAASRGGDSLVVSSHEDGFTAVVLRAGQPLYVRGVICEVEDRADELYRFLLFYRDRNAPPAGPHADPHADPDPDADPDATLHGAGPAAPVYLGERIESLLVSGPGLDYAQASSIVEETLSAPPRPVRPEDLRLSFPSSGIDFQQVAAPAGLAALAWA